jgi:hypothetical protein
MPIRRRCLVLVALALCLPLLAPPVRADEHKVATTLAAADGTEFMRFVDDHHGGGRLETAIATYRNDAGQTVRLVAAVHIGEKSYYEGLNDTFRSDDAVLYEMVKPKDMGAPKPHMPAKSGISQFQHFLKDSLDLDFQLDDVDYSRPNFVHADLDAETFEKMQEERGESMFTLMLRQMMDAMSHPENGPAANLDGDQITNELITLITRPDSERQLKLLLARHMGDAEKAAAGLDGPNGSVILTERNKAALKVLADTLKQGKQHISVFYGAAHMPSMSKTLEKDMGFHLVGVEYRMAWDLAIRADQPSLVEQFLREGIKSLSDDSDQK